MTLGGKGGKLMKYLLLILFLSCADSRYSDIEEKCILLDDRCEFQGYIGTDRIEGNTIYVKGIKLKIKEK
jgi:hypothetical protein